MSEDIPMMAVGRDVRRLACVVAACVVAALVTGAPARAQCVISTQTIMGSTTSGNAIGLSASAGCIVNAGAITETSTTGTAKAVVINGSGTITNSGPLTTTTTSGFTIALQVNAPGDVFNSGAVTTTATNGFATGIQLNGTGVLVNTGAVTSITTAGGFAVAVQTNSGGTLTNTGTASAIATAGGFATALQSNGPGIISNSGTATAFAVNGFANGIDMNANGTIINTGTISVSGTGNAFATGIQLNGTGTIINTGPITAAARFSSGIVVVGDSSTIINAAPVSVPGGTAISMQGNNETLTLLSGSWLAGAIQLTGAGNTVNLGAANQNLTFNSLAGVAVTSNLPFVAAGNQAATIDPTPFGLADRTLMDFTRGVSGMLDTLGGGTSSNGPQSSAFAPSEGIAGRIEEIFSPIPGLAYGSDQAMVFKAPTAIMADGRTVWARGFGGERTQGPQGDMVGAHTSFFGGAVGFDMVARPDLRLGFFAGGGKGRLSLDGNAGSTDTETAFGGLYGRWSFVTFGRASFLDFALHGGGSFNSTSRTVNNNTLPTGIEIATASYNSSYVTPELKYGINVPLWAQVTLTPSVHVRYVAGFFGGYTETGTSAPLTVASRTIQDFEERGELKLTLAQPIGSNLLLTGVHVGFLGLERVGDTTVDATLLGINLPFVTPGKNAVAGVLGGGGFEWRTREGISFFGAVEAIGFSDQSTVWSARGGMRVAF